MHYQTNGTKRTEPAELWGRELPSESRGLGEAPDPSTQRVIRQLVEALLFERLVDSRTETQPVGLATDSPESTYQAVAFGVGNDDYRCFAAIKAFGRVRVADGSVQRISHGVGRAAGLREIVRSLPIEEVDKQRLLGELLQTVELCRWNRDCLQHHLQPRRALGFQELESALVEGHLYHPSFKARTGFSLDDHRTFGPEAGGEFQLEWLAIARPRLEQALPCGEATFWRHELGEREFLELSKRLSRRGGDLDEYSLVPIHPWQLRSLRSRLEPAVTTGEVVLLGSIGDHYRASQSLRTLVNTSHPERANVKLPLNVVCTSSHRNLEPHFVRTAPMLSDWLETLTASDPYLQDGPRLLLLKEYAGLSCEVLAEAEADGVWSELQGMVGAIYRESVLSKLEPGEAAVPFTAMMVVEVDGRPFIADWLDTYATEPWVDRLLEVVLLPLWHMLVHHGIAFEAHAQNLILVHRDGWPTKIVLRDFHEDTEFVPDFLARPELEPRFERLDPHFETIADDDGYRMASTEALRQLFMDTVYVFNLADLSFLLERYRNFTESRFWSLVRSHLRNYQLAGVTDRARIDRISTDAPEIIVESLLKKKLLGGGVLDYFEHQVPNTLCG